MRAYIVLCDFAEQDPTGKIHILGAGWSQTGPAPSPHGVVVFFKMPSNRKHPTIPVQLRMMNDRGSVVEIPGPAGIQRLDIAGQIELQGPNVDPEDSFEMEVAFTVNLNAMLLPAGRYTWVAEVDGKEVATTDFIFRSEVPALGR
jgi:hypothetical protein